MSPNPPASEKQLARHDRPGVPAGFVGLAGFARVHSGLGPFRYPRSVVSAEGIAKASQPPDVVNGRVAWRRPDQGGRTSGMVLEGVRLSVSRRLE